MKEVIGKVTLDLSLYSGQDYYSEGADEDLLLELVKNNEPWEYNRVIAENAGWSRLYHLSDLRGNIVDFLPISKKDSVLEVGAGCGAITGTLASKAESVTCIELSKKRSMINAYRNKERDNVEIKVGNFQDIEKSLTKQYDYIMLIGVLEYAASYISSDSPYETFLNTLLAHLKEGGRLVIAIENKYGLKYWAGCREDHLGSFYSGIEGYPYVEGVKTFSRDGLLKLIKKTGCKVKEFYPFPDYKLPVTIYSSERLPHKGELTDSAPNFDNTRIVAFDERKAFDEIIGEGRFPEYSNSFLFMLEKGTRVESFSVRNPIYSRHSNERDSKYAIRTDILRDGNGKQFVVKYPMTEDAISHIESMEDSYRALRCQYEDSIFEPNSCRIVRNDNELCNAEFDYISGKTLDEMLVSWVEKGNKDLVKAVIDRFAKAVTKLPKTGKSNLDLIFTNIFPEEATADRVCECKWTVIDYEWVKECDEDPKFIIFRALRYFIEECVHLGYGKLIEELKLYDMCGIDEVHVKAFEEKERLLQQEISGNRISLIGYYSIFGKDRYDADTLLSRSSFLPRIDRVKVYYDLGTGFNEENTAYITGRITVGDRVVLDIPVIEGTRSMRVDPSDLPCMVKLEKMPGNDIMVNGSLLDGNVVFFSEPDPQIIIQDVPAVKTAHFEYIIAAFDERFFAPVGSAIAQQHAKSIDSVKDIFRKKGPYEKVRLS